MRDPLRLLIASALLAGGAALADDPKPAATAPAAVPTLHLADGGYASGALADSDKAETIRWQSPAFAKPLEFPLDAVASVGFPTAATPPKPQGDYSFELAGGDVLFGTLVGLDDKAATIEAPPFGRLTVKRASLRRIDRRRDGSELIYLGPNGLTGWRVPPAFKTDVTVLGRRVVVINGARQPEPPAPPPPPPNGGWREEAGQLVTDHEGATLRGDFTLPPRAAIEFEVSWTKRPDFVLALGTDDTEASVKRAFRFEVWGDDLVAFREGEKEADLAPLQAVTVGPGRAHFLVFLDQEQGRMLVATPGGKTLADLEVADAKSAVGPYLRLTSVRGDLHLESLRVAKWAGEAPRDVAADKSRVHRPDGSIVYGQVLRYDPSSKEFVLREEGKDKGETRVAADAIASLFLSPQAEEGPRAIRASYQDGTRLSGDLVKVEGGSLVVSVPGFEAPLRLPVAGLRSLASTKQGPPAAPVAWTPRLEMDGLRLRGVLIDARESADGSCIDWVPEGATSSSPIRRGMSGRVIFKEPPPPKPPTTTMTRQAVNGMVVRRVVAQPAQVVQPAQPVGIQILNALAGQPNQPNQTGRPQPRRPAPPPTGPLAIHLRTGDVIPSEITRIDEQGVSFKSTMTASTFVAHDKIKAVELAHDEPIDVRLTKTKRERLLTLPRMQKGSPPTQLIRSRNGDYLRGRVVAMDDKKLAVEVHLENKEIPRDRVGKIIWFHADEIEGAKAPAKPPEPAGATRVQALRRDGIRLTFLADHFSDGALSGKSDVLGTCKVALDEVDQFLIGGAIEQAAAQVAYGPWRLHNAPEPKLPEADGSSSGGESPLVGKPAPDFELALLDGKKFHLAESKGKVVVLDFWATWCGPCLQAMPQVEAVAEEFKDQGVKLVAVNLQEDPKQITAMLERHKMHPTVALDRDGIVAQKYEANAIPQTVIIGRDGKVARLFVGSSPHLGDQLREALKAALAEGQVN